MLNQSPEQAQLADPSLDFCLWEYPQPKPPHTDGSLRSINLLIESAEFAGVGSQMRALCSKLRSGLGDWQTVWGVKWFDGQLSWELYFYDYARVDRSCSVTRVVELLEDLFECRLTVDEQRHYFMFSLDIDVALLRRQRSLDSCDLYLGNVANHGAMISSGLCYHYHNSQAQLRNLYYFYDAKTGLDDVCEKLALSIHNPSPELSLPKLLPSPLLNCRTLVVAHKPRTDALYFSGITPAALLYSLRRAALPTQLSDSLAASIDRYGHLLFDIGVDYRCNAEQVVWNKVSYYGVF